MIIGLDPGLTRTGLCLLSPTGELLAAATFAADDTVFPTHHRVIDLSRRIVKYYVSLKDRLALDDPSDILLIEKPIMGKNVENYEKQMRLFSSIITEFGGLVDYIHEVNPTAMKKAITGNGTAGKLDIILASPFDGVEDVSTKDLEAMADAWGIGMCWHKKAWDVQYTPRRSIYTTMPASTGPLVVYPDHFAS